MRLHRFYVNGYVKQPLGEEIVVDDVSIIKQWARVFRYEPGDSVILFDGHFKDYTYEIESISTKEAKLHFISVKEIPPASKELTLYISIIKKDNVELVVQKCTELGINRIVPILTERSEKKSLNMERVRTIAIESSEQCGRGDVPKIEDIVTLPEAFLNRDSSVQHMVSDMGGLVSNSSAGKDLLSKNKLALWVGPEGGWGPKDWETFKSGDMSTVSFGSTVMRAETACIVISGIFLLQ